MTDIDTLAARVYRSLRKRLQDDGSVGVRGIDLYQESGSNEVTVDINLNIEGQDDPVLFCWRFDESKDDPDPDEIAEYVMQQISDNFGELE
jgi:hypothetical protein